MEIFCYRNSWRRTGIYFWILYNRYRKAADRFLAVSLEGSKWQHIPDRPIVNCNSKWRHYRAWTGIGFPIPCTNITIRFCIHRDHRRKRFGRRYCSFDSPGPHCQPGAEYCYPCPQSIPQLLISRHNLPSGRTEYINHCWQYPYAPADRNQPAFYILRRIISDNDIFMSFTAAGNQQQNQH